MADDQNNKKFGGFEIKSVEMKSREYQLESLYPPGTPKVIRWVIKYSGGFVKGEKQASYVLIGLSGVAIVLTIILAARVFSGPPAPPVGPPQNPTPQSSGEFGEPPGGPF